MKNQKLEQAHEDIELLIEQQEVNKHSSLNDDLKENFLDELNKLEENLKTAQNEIIQKTQIITDLQKMLQEKESQHLKDTDEIANLRKDIENRSKAIEENNKLISSLEKQVKQFTQDNANEQQKHKDKIANLNKEIEEKINAIEENKGLINLLNDKVNGLTQNNKKLQKEYNELTAQQKSDKDTVFRLESEIVTHKEKINEAEEKVNKITHTVSETEKQLQQEKLNFKNLTGEKEQLNREKLELQELTNKHQSTINTHENIIKELEKKLEQNEKNKTEIQNELNVKNIEFQELNNKKVEIKKALELTKQDLQTLKIELKEKESQHLKDINEIAKLSTQVAEKAILIEQLQKRLREGFTQLKVEKRSDISENISEQHLNFNPRDKHDLKIDNVLSEEILGTNELALSKKSLSLFSDAKYDSNLNKNSIQSVYSVRILPSHTRHAATQTLDNAHKNTYQQNADKKFIDWQNVVQLIRRIDGKTKVEDNSEALHQCIAQQKIDFTQQDKSFTLSQNKSTNAITLESYQASFDHFVETLSKLINEQRKVKPDKTIHIAFKKIPDLNKEEYQKALQKLSQHQNIKIKYGGANRVFAEALKQSKAEPYDALKLFDKQENHYRVP